MMLIVISQTRIASGSYLRGHTLGAQPDFASRNRHTCAHEIAFAQEAHQTEKSPNTCKIPIQIARALSSTKTIVKIGNMRIYS